MKFTSLTGSGTIVATPTADHFKLQANQSSFNGDLVVNLAEKCFIMENASSVKLYSGYFMGAKQVFEMSGGKYAAVQINGTDGGDGEFILDYSFTHDYALRIGNLSGNGFAKITGKYNANVGEAFRYLSVYQDKDDVFEGQFIDSKNGNGSLNRSVGLIKNGTSNLTLTGQNESTANLEVEKGTLTLKDGGSWAGQVIVNGGTLAADGEAHAGADVTINNGGTLAFVSADSALDISGSLVFNTGSALDLTQIDIRDLTGTQSILLAAATSITGLDAAAITGPCSLAAGATWSVDVKTATDLGLDMFALSPTAQYLVLTLSGTPLTATIVDAAFAASTLTLTLAETWAELGSMSELALAVGADLWQTIETQMAGSGGIGQYAAVSVLDADGIAWTGPLSLNGYAGAGDGTYFIAYIPEPATGTLALLALASLTVRRRRNR